MSVSTAVVVTPVAVGQENSAATFNLSISAIQELQTLVNTIEAQPVMELTSTAAQSIPNAAWTQISTFSATPTYSAGAGLTGSTNGIVVSSSGRYVVEGMGIFVANATGGRLMSVATSTGASSTIQASAAGFAALASSIALTNELTAAVGDKICLWVYQTSGAALNVSVGARLILRQMTS